ncbi:MAG: sigma-70 family RNA polymerase sigma factor [Acidobacteria bacterium]|nr:sigma-70 family RNA polymerase sigma factor [Acidobacteriota bacterium]
MLQSGQDPTAPGEVTQILTAARQGDAGARDRLMTLIYGELRAVAHRQLRRWRPGQTLATTALVHEAYLKLVDQAGASWQDRAHFLSVAGIAMRHILVDAARRRAAKKRGGEGLRIPLDELPGRQEPDADSRAVEILALDAALTSLAARNERLSRLVELRFFAGLTEEETAQTLGTSERTVRRDWRKARAFLFDALRERTAG